MTALYLQGSIQALHMLREKKNRKEKVREEEQRRQAVLNGDNPDEVLLREKRAREFTKRKTDFEENRKQRHLEIVARLLEEEKVKKRSERLAAKDHWKGRWLVAGEKSESKLRKGRSGSKKMLRNMHNPSENEGVNPLISGDETGEGEGGEGCESSEECDGGEGVKGEQVIDVRDLDEVLAKPEIDGLWSQRENGKKPQLHLGL